MHRSFVELVFLRAFSNPSLWVLIPAMTTVHRETDSYMANERAMTDAEILAQIPAAEARAAEADRSEPRARSARYDRRTGRVVVELTNGCGFTFPARYGQGLQDATPEDLARVSVDAGGAALRWEALDVDLGVVGLLAGVFGGCAWMGG
jgi:hypothetical protein